jgi:hypothetical protein
MALSMAQLDVRQSKAEPCLGSDRQQALDWRADCVRATLRSENPTVLHRAGFAVIAVIQQMPGCCVLISDDPDANRLTGLPGTAGWGSSPT